jgi:hypothetical protein
LERPGALDEVRLEKDKNISPGDLDLFVTVTDDRRRWCADLDYMRQSRPAGGDAASALGFNLNPNLNLNLFARNCLNLRNCARCIK